MKPTIFAGVPRIYNRIVEGVKAKFEETTGIKKCLIDSGVNSKLNAMHKDGSYEGGIYDSLVFSKVRESFGGRIRRLASGSAPIKDEVYEFIKVIMCCPFVQGYGQTENTGAAFSQKLLNPAGNVGAVVVNVN